MQKHNYKVLVVGSGAREHAITWKLTHSPLISHIFVAPGNHGTELIALSSQPHPVHVQNVPLTTNQHICDFSKQRAIDLVIVGPEAPLASGLSDQLSNLGIPCFGPSAAAARIESDKAFAKDLMTLHSIPTPAYQVFTNCSQALQYLDHAYSHNRRVVIKASGLAAGKGVVVPSTHHEATQAVSDMLDRSLFGDAGSKIIIEDYLEGDELSVLAFCDGHTAVCMPAAQDHKRIFDGNLGPNTGGMGAYAPTPLCDDRVSKEALERVILPALKGLRLQGSPFVGVLFAGLILTQHGLYCLEFNCRFGDPETQAILPLMQSDLLLATLSCVQGTLSSDKIHFHPNKFCCTVVASSRGYPQRPETGHPITGLNTAQSSPHVSIFHAGTKRDLTRVLTNGGRVLCVSGVSDSLQDAVRLSYQSLHSIHFEGMHYRRDIAAKQLPPLKVAVLGSTRGSSLQPIIDSLESNALPITLTTVISNRQGAPILSRAKHYRPTYIPSNPQFEEHAIRAISDAGGADLILCIGFMKILSPRFVELYRDRILNVHPSLLPKFAGGMDLDVHRRVLLASERQSGCTVHLVDDGVDTGTILLQKTCPVEPNDTPESLKARVQALEGPALIEVIHLYRQGLLPHRATYRDSGVDTQLGAAIVEHIKPICSSTATKGANAALGGFGGIFDLSTLDYRDPLLVSSTDGVGTKLLLSVEANSFDTIGQDLVAMCVNDVLAQGAQPLFFLDYFATAKLHVDQTLRIIQGIASACKTAGCALIGGETAEMPDMYRPGHYDLAGFAVGAVERHLLLPRTHDMTPGDHLIALTSSGIHSNGYTLVRRLLSQHHIQLQQPPPFHSTQQHLYQELLKPTFIYVNSLIPLINAQLLKGIAHITGGGLYENLPRILPPHLAAQLDGSKWPCPPVIQWLAHLGHLHHRETLSTWNAGIGIVLVVDPAHTHTILSSFQQLPYSALHVGHLVPRESHPVEILNTDLLLQPPPPTTTSQSTP